MRYLFASMLGSLLTIFVMSLREAALYGHLAAQAHTDFRPHMRSTSLQSPLPQTNSCQLSPQSPHIRNGVWHVFSDGVHEMSVYGAYYDDRKGLGAAAVVRIFGVSTASKRSLVLCQLWYANHSSNPVVTVAGLAVPGRGYRSNITKVLYQEYLFTCPVGMNDSLPTNVSLAFRPCQNSTIHMPIVYAKREQPKVEFGVCVAAAYGDIHPQRLVEWMELLSILGVKEINIYINSVSNRTESTFLYYQRKKLVVVRRAPSPIQEVSYWSGKLAVIPGFNDCVYRNMYRHNFTMIIDFDEIIVPHMHSNYSAMMADLTTFHKRLKVIPGLLLFRNTYFFLDMGMTNNMSGNMTMMSYTRRVDISPRSYSAKSIFNPRICVIAWNHFCLLRMPRTPVLNVDPLYALSHHYKKCHFSKDECQQMMQRNVTDTAILKFKISLKRRLKKVHIT